MKRKKQNREKSKSWKILLIIVLIVVVLLVGIRLLKNGNIPEKKISYQFYQQPCEKDDSYFEEVSKIAYGFINKSWVKEFKDASIYCNELNVKNITQDEFEDLDLDCKCFEYGIKKCLEGYELVGNQCYDAKEKTYTNVLKVCAKYECNNNYFAIMNKEI